MSAVVALAGPPNTGKSSLFNALTGALQKVGNFPGVTVEKKEGIIKSSEMGNIRVIDLPGLYSLCPHSPDEEVASGILLNQNNFECVPDLVVVVADSTNLERTLNLALEVKRLGRSMIIAFNMIDLAEKNGLDIDLEVLERELQVPCVATSAVKRGGTSALRKLVEHQLTLRRSIDSREILPCQSMVPTREQTLADYRELDRILAIAIKRQKTPSSWTKRLDRVLLHPVLGLPILAMILMGMFQAVFTWAEAPMDAIEVGIASLGSAVGMLIPYESIRSLVVDGVFAGIGSVLVFLPQILILFLFIFIFEGTGYMMRAALLMNRLMNKFGLQGQSFVPLLSSFACAIPGIMGTRTIRHPRDRLLTIMVAPLMTCSARLPVYVLLIGAFIPNTVVWGPIRGQGLVMFSLFLMGILSAMVTAWVAGRTLLPGNRAPCIMELPAYKLPQLRFVLRQLALRAKYFLIRAGKVIFVVSVALWFLSSYPQHSNSEPGDTIRNSYAGQIADAIHPIFEPLGFDWRITASLIPSFAAREVIVGALGTIFAIEGADEDESGMHGLQAKIHETWPISTGLALLVWYIFAPQCLATFAVMRRETNGWKYPLIMFVYLLVLAYGAAWATHYVTERLMEGESMVSPLSTNSHFSPLPRSVITS